MNATVFAALVFGFGGYIIGYLSRREDERHHRPALEAERFVRFRGIRKRPLSSESWATEEGRVERLREAGML